MFRKEAYCLNCDEMCEYITKTEHRKTTVKDLTFDVDVIVAFCKKCGEEVFPSEVTKANDLIIFDEYRRLKGLLTSKEIKAIRQKRNMSQVELARFIDCGEKNIARYENGTIQDKVFDLLIRMVGDDECFKAMSKINGTVEATKAFVKKDTKPVTYVDHGSNYQWSFTNSRKVNRNENFRVIFA